MLFTGTKFIGLGRADCIEFEGRGLLGAIESEEREVEGLIDFKEKELEGFIDFEANLADQKLVSKEIFPWKEAKSPWYREVTPMLQEAYPALSRILVPALKEVKEKMEDYINTARRHLPKTRFQLALKFMETEREYRRAQEELREGKRHTEDMFLPVAMVAGVLEDSRPQDELAEKKEILLHFITLSLYAVRAARLAGMKLEEGHQPMDWIYPEGEDPNVYGIPGLDLALSGHDEIWGNRNLDPDDEWRT